jgi:hypothetical protein
MRHTRIILLFDGELHCSPLPVNQGRSDKWQAANVDGIAQNGLPHQCIHTEEFVVMFTEMTALQY